MRDFLLDEKGDLVLTDGDIQFAGDADAMVQKVRMHIGTNRGEWFLNNRQGVNFGALLRKGPDPEQVREEIATALLQLDSSLRVTAFSAELDKETRRMDIRFEAARPDGSGVEVRQSY